MKPETRTFYQTAVDKAVVRIQSSLDEALDLEMLARTAALSTFHFHRVFRGMVGETPLDMHRRLRLERAARELLESGAAVTRIAFDAGYETHEAFTRAFRKAYGVSPSAFREVPVAGDATCARPRPTRLASPSGIHFPSEPGAWPLLLTKGEFVMNVTIETIDELRVATVPHVGPYARISEAFARLGALAGAAGLFRHPEAAMIALYHDDPETTPAAELRSDAGIVVPSGVELPEGLFEKKIPAGRYARMVHEGPYDTLGDAWARLMGQWLPESGERVGAGASYELYLNDPSTTAAADLRTAIYLSLA